MSGARRVCRLAFFAMLAGCGSDPLPIINPPPPGTPPPATPPPPPGGMMTNPGALGADAANRVYELGDAVVFGVNSGVLLSIGAVDGASMKAPFTIRSQSNSDEASGSLSLDPCVFEVAMSSFPPNVRVLAGAKLALRCTYDAAAAKLVLVDPATNVMSEGVACEVVAEEVRCPASGG